MGNTDEKSTAIREAGYIEGRRAGLRATLSFVLRELGADIATTDPLSLELQIGRLTKQLEDTRAQLRMVCREFGDDDWDDDLYLADVVEKHLGKHLHARR